MENTCSTSIRETWGTLKRIVDFLFIDIHESMVVQFEKPSLSG